MWGPPMGFETWLDEQTFKTSQTWVLRMMGGLGIAGMLKALVEGRAMLETPYIGLHTGGYIGLALASLFPGRMTRLVWQVFSPALLWLHSLGFMFMCSLPLEDLSVMAVSARSGVDFVYMSVLTAWCDRNPLVMVVVSRCVLAYCHGRALQHMDFVEHPVRQAVAAHIVATLITTAARCMQLRAYLRVQASLPQPAAKSAPTQKQTSTRADAGSSQVAAPDFTTTHPKSAADASDSVHASTAVPATPPADSGQYVSAVQYPTGRALASLDAMLTQRRKQKTTRVAPSAMSLEHGIQVVSMKFHNLDPCQLPPTFASLIQTCVRARVPDGELGIINVRQGCVLISVELPAAALTEQDLPADMLTHDALVQLVASSLVDAGADQLLPPGSALEVQRADELTCYVWNPDSCQFQLAPEQPGADEGHPARLFTALAAQCQLLGSVPAVHCLEADSSQALTLPLQLQVPQHSRLLSWQPAAVSDNVDTGILVAGTKDSVSEPATDVRLLVRDAGGAYLPVSVQLATQEVRPGPTPTTCVVEVQVSVSLPAAKPQGLQLQLWCKSTSTQGFEVLCAHCPLLALTEEWRVAAVQLQDHLAVMGGVQATHVLLPPAQQPGSQTDSHSSSNSSSNGDASRLLTSLATCMQHAASSGPLLAIQTHVLLHLTLYGLCDIAQLLVTVMSGPTAPAGSLLVAPQWFIQAANGVDAQTDQSHAATGSLMHAAMESGMPAMLEKVTRWGQLYGGRQWRWPWSLTDAVGCTALHHLAFQTGPGVCAALVKTLIRMLPPSEVQAARHVWFHGMGSVSVTPAQLFNRMHPDEDMEGLWTAVQDSADTKQPEQVQDSTRTCSNSRGVPDPMSDTISPPAPPLPSSPASPDAAQSDWWRAIKQAWKWRQPEDYHTWLNNKVSNIMQVWVHVDFALFLVLAWKAAQLGGMELPLVVMFHLPYISMITATTFGFKRLGSWQSWMPVLSVVHSASLLCTPALAPDRKDVWRHIVRCGADVLYYAGITSMGDLNPLQYVLATRLLQAYAMHSAYDWLTTAEVRHPLLRSAAINTGGLLVTCLIRVLLVRSFHRWQSAQGHRKALAGGPGAATDSQAQEDTRVLSSCGTGPSASGKAKTE